MGDEIRSSVKGMISVICLSCVVYLKCIHILMQLRRTMEKKTHFWRMAITKPDAISEIPTLF